MPCTWQPYTNREIELTRLRRRIHRLETRLACLLRSNKQLHRDTIIQIEAELAHLRGQAGRG